MSEPIDLVLSHLQTFKKTSNGYLAKCPVHDDKQASLSISPGSDGRVLLKCFAGCSTEEIVRALGIEMRDLFPKEGGGGISHPAKTMHTCTGD